MNNVNYEHYKEWAKNHDHIIQMSHPRSGRYWLIRLLTGITELKHSFMEYAEKHGYSRYNSAHPARIREGNNWDSFPKYVLLIRDPRDVFCSFCHYAIANNVDYDPFDNMCFWEQQTRQWKSDLLFFTRWNTIVIQYEKLCLFPGTTLRRILEFADFPEVNAINDIVFSEDRPVAYSNSWDRYKEHCCRWKREQRFTPIHNTLVLSHLGDIMLQYGYGEDGHNRIISNTR